VKVSRDRPRWPKGFRVGSGPGFSWCFSTTRVVGRQPNVPAAFTQEKSLVLNFRGWVDLMAHGSVGGTTEKIPSDTTGTVQLVAQRLNHYASLGPHFPCISWSNESQIGKDKNCFPICYTTSLFYIFFVLTSVADLHHFLIYIHFWFNALWLAVFCYADPFVLMGISFFIYAHFFSNATRALNKGWMFLQGADKKQKLYVPTMYKPHRRHHCWFHSVKNSSKNPSSQLHITVKSVSYYATSEHRASEKQ